MADCVTGLLIAGAAVSLGGITYNEGQGPKGSHGVCGSVCVPAPAARPCSGHSHYKGTGSAYATYAGYAPTPEYMSGTTYYGYSGSMVPSYAGVGYSSPYAASSTYYYY